MEKRAGGFKVRRPGSRAGISFCQTIGSADILPRTCSKMVLSITRKYKPLPLKVIFLCIPAGTFDNDLSRPRRTSLCKSREAWIYTLLLPVFTEHSRQCKQYCDLTVPFFPMVTVDSLLAPGALQSVLRGSHSPLMEAPKRKVTV